MFKNKFIFLMIIAMLVIILEPVNISIGEVKANTSFAGGSGTKDDPYLIDDVIGLFSISGYLDSHFKLTADIDLEGYTWSALGVSNSFTGTLDGGGHTISNIHSNDGGLFHRIKNAEIKNIVLDNVNISTTANDVGAIANSSEGYIEISNVKIYTGEQNSISGSDRVGAIIGYGGYDNGEITLNNVEVNADVKMTYSSNRSSYSNGGGLVGQVYSLNVKNSVIRVNIEEFPPKKNGQITDDLIARVGGIVGYSEYLTVENTNIHADINNGNWVGGIVGHHYGRNLSVKNVVISGDIRNSRAKAGGVIGFLTTLARQNYVIEKTFVDINIKSGVEHQVGTNNSDRGRVGLFVGDSSKYSPCEDETYYTYCLEQTSFKIIESAYRGAIDITIKSSYRSSTSLSTKMFPVIYKDFYLSGSVNVKFDPSVNKNQTITLQGEANSGSLYGTSENMIFLSDISSESDETTFVLTRGGNNKYQVQGKFDGFNSDAQNINPVVLNVPSMYNGFDFQNVWYPDSDLGHPNLKRSGTQGQIGYIEPTSEQLVVRETTKNETSITLEWNDVGAASYTVLRDGAEIATVMDLSYTDIDLGPNTTYEYEVVANY